MIILTYSYVLHMDDEEPILIFIDNTQGIALLFNPSRPSFLDVTSTTSLVLEDIEEIPLATAHILARRITSPLARGTAHRLIDSLATPAGAHPLMNFDGEPDFEPERKPLTNDAVDAMLHGFDGGDGPDA